MRKTYRTLAYLVSLGVIAQAMAIALGVFIMVGDIDDGVTIDDNYENFGFDLHWLDGMMVIPLIAIALMVVSFFAKIPGGVKWAGWVLLAVVVQIVLAFVSFGVPGIGALHAINAFVVLGVSLYTARVISVREVATTTTGPSTVPTA